MSSFRVAHRGPWNSRNPHIKAGVIDVNSQKATAAFFLTVKLAQALPSEQAREVTSRLRNLDVRIIALGTVPHRMIYDKERIAVQAGKPVEFRFTNTDSMPHNFAITVPGALEEVGAVDGGGVDVDQGFVWGEGGVGDILPEEGAVGVFFYSYSFHEL